MTKQITFVVAEDEARLRDSLVKKIAGCEPDFVCLGSAADGEDALLLINQTMPDILVTDIRMPVLSGLELIEQVRRMSPHLAIIIVSGYGDFEYARTAMKWGVSDYLLKPVNLAKLHSALRKTRMGVLAESGLWDTVFGLDADHAIDSLADYADALENLLIANLRQEVDLGHLCLNLGIKPAYAIKIYKRYKGITPMRHLTVLRINQAKHILTRNPELGIKQVADLVGFADQLYFSRVFSTETGMSPSDWRDLHRRGGSHSAFQTGD